MNMYARKTIHMKPGCRSHQARDKRTRMRMRMKMGIALLSLLFLTLRANAQPDTVRLVFIGDVMAHALQLEHACGKQQELPREPEAYKWDSYFSGIAGYLKKADYAVANMEFSCGTAPYSGYPMFSAPASLAQAACDAGIDLFMCANNHIGDKGVKGLESTIYTYNSIGVDRVGVYADSADFIAGFPLVRNIGNPNGDSVRVAFINFTYGTNGMKIAPPYIVPLMDTAVVRQAIVRARERGAEYVVALPHWGVEYKLNPSVEQQKWREFLFDLGVDAIVGSHPHVVQPVIMENGRVTAYSLGNFISNMSAANTQAGYMLVLELTRGVQGRIKTSVKVEKLWCPRFNGPGPDWTTVLYREYEDKPELFRNRQEHAKMVRTWGAIEKNN